MTVPLLDDDQARVISRTIINAIMEHCQANTGAFEEFKKTILIQEVNLHEGERRKGSEDGKSL